MALWTEHVVPRLVDQSLSSPRVMRLRAEVCAGLVGRVLELGFGSGLNVGSYPPAVVRVDAVEPSDVAWRMSRARRGDSTVPIHRVGLDGQHLEAEASSYDAVLSTFTLCTIPDVNAALAEVRRVLRPGGELHFLEHGRSPEPGVARWQHRMDPLQGRIAGGCHLSRDIPALVRLAGLELADVSAAYLPGPRMGRPWSYLFRARAAGPST